jgi:phosphoglucosamine mutase
VIFTAPDGSVIHGDRILALSAIALKAQGRLKDDTLVCTVMSNLGLHATMARHGIAVEVTPVGDRHVIERMCEGGFTFGGENSGHLIFSEHATTGDGILSALQVLRIMKQSGVDIAELAAEMTEYPSLLVNLPVKAKPPLESLPKLSKLMAEASIVFADQGRHLIRYSGTEKKLRVMVEHRSDIVAREWVDRFADAIHEEIA